MNKYDKVKLDINNLIQEYKDGGSITEMSIRYGVSDKVIRRLFKLNNLQLRSKAESNRVRFGYTVDASSFSTITSEKDSYFLGLILADGCISNGYLSLTLKQTDGYILKELQNHLGMNYGYSESSTNDKRTNKTYYRSQLQVKNKSITENLRNQNITPNKSTIEKLPNIDWINDRHFWRGLIDGDGHLKMSKTSRSLIVFVGSEEVVNGFIQFCEKSISLKVPRIAKTMKCKNKTLYHVQINNTDAREIAKYLYKDSTIYLKRKYDEVLKLE